jgi:hypothetical protein
MGIDDHTFTEILGSDAELDDAINYYLDLEESDDDDDDDMYEE